MRGQPVMRALTAYDHKSSPENRLAGWWCGRQSFAANEVLPQLNELLFSSVEGVLMESVEVIDTVVRVEVRTTAGRAACPGCG
ncbi:hypothetical protein [Streptomyces sp. NPDC057460]|uniref:hypothetical protein n=1 Tax=Streptomyces sp. NPDC057460 TaxID=3346141 RepID=UPI0036996802